MRAIAAVVILAFAALVAASSLTHLRTEIFNRVNVPEEWVISSELPNPDQKVNFILALHQQNLEELERLFWAVSTPGSPQYQQFLTREEVLALVSPPAADRDRVYRYLVADAGLAPEEIKDCGDAYKITTTVAKAENMFQTKYLNFDNVVNPKAKLTRAVGSITLPAHIKPLIYMVSGVSDFPPAKPPAKIASAASSGNAEAVVPQTLWSVYNYPSSDEFGAYALSNSSSGVAEFGAGQDFDANDLSTFASLNNINITPLKNSHIVNPLPPTGVEGTLDIQYIAGAGLGADLWYWTEENWVYDFAVNFQAASEVPQIVSISYGWSELQQCVLTNECSILGVDSQGYVLRTNVEFQKIGLTGVSLLCASGDSGANGRTDEGCTADKLRPAYPAASPYITAVGATQLNPGCTPLNTQTQMCSGYTCCAGGDEQAVTYDYAMFASGGGFSNYAARPSYQDAAVRAYFTSGVQLPPASMYNNTNRGFPDVSSLGSQILIYENDQGGVISVGGTSASSPSWGGYAYVMNQAVVKKTGKPLGFLNPFLYKMFADCPSCFKDITKGDNICTESGCAATCKGYYAYKGWDPVTGLGGPNMVNILNYINSHF